VRAEPEFGAYCFAAAQINVRKGMMKTLRAIVACTAVLVACASCARGPQQTYSFLAGQSPVHVDSYQRGSSYTYSFDGNYDQLLPSISSELMQLKFRSWPRNNEYEAGDIHFQQDQGRFFGTTICTVITLYRDTALIPGDTTMELRSTPGTIGVTVSITKR
jgi:hypothetical protein